MPPQRRRRATLTPLHAALAPPSRRSTPSRRPRATREQAHPAAAHDVGGEGGGGGARARVGPGGDGVAGRAGAIS